MAANGIARFQAAVARHARQDRISAPFYEW